MIAIDKIEDSLKDKGYKLTRQRKSIIEVLTENIGKFLSVEDIYSKCKEKYPKTNLSTVYRNLEILEGIDLVHKTNLNGLSASYEIICTDCHHHHVICKTCGKTEVIDFCPIQEFTAKVAEDGFLVTDHKIELYGYCKNCTKNLYNK